MQVSIGTQVAAEGILNGYLCLMVKEQLTGELECFIVAEQQLIMKVTGLEAPLLLLMLSYCLDTTYPHGTNSMTLYCFFRSRDEAQKGTFSCR